MERPSFYKLPQEFARQQAAHHSHGHSHGPAPQQQHHHQVTGLNSGVQANVWQPTASGGHSPHCRQQHGSSPLQTVSGSPIPHVVYGSPASDAGLRSGDAVMAIGSKSMSSMGHGPASELIKKSGNSLDITVSRGQGNGPLTPPVSPKPNPYLSKVLPTSRGVIPKIRSETQSSSEQEQQMYSQEKEREQQAVHNQPYRTLPVVQPQPKPRHDYPTGSYLNYMKDPNWRGSPSASPVPPTSAHQVHQPDKLQQVMHQICADQDRVVHNAYNSPINLYSSQNIQDVLSPIASQPGLQQQQQQPGYQGMSSAAQQQRMSPMPSYAAPGTIPHPVHLEAAGQAFHERPSSAADITQSPTYQLVQEMEVGRDHGPAHEIEYIVAGPEFGAGPEGFPAQSQSFNALMNSLLSHPRV